MTAAVLRNRPLHPANARLKARIVEAAESVGLCVAKIDLRSRVTYLAKDSEVRFIRNDFFQGGMGMAECWTRGQKVHESLGRQLLELVHAAEQAVVTRPADA